VEELKAALTQQSLSAASKYAADIQAMKPEVRFGLLDVIIFSEPTSIRAARFAGPK
jgi:hypothetical protein